MQTYVHGFEEQQPLSSVDFFRQFNNNRIYKNIIGTLLKLNKTDVKDYKVLEPGCGPGNKLRFFTDIGVASALDMPYEDDSFDIILCSGLLACFDKDEDFVKFTGELKRLLKKDGVLFIVDINENYISALCKQPCDDGKVISPF